MSQRQQRRGRRARRTAGCPARTGIANCAAESGGASARRRGGRWRHDRATTRTPRPAAPRAACLYSCFPGDVSVSTSCASVMRTACAAARAVRGEQQRKAPTQAHESYDAGGCAQAYASFETRLVREVIQHHPVHVVVVLDVFTADVGARRASRAATPRARGTARGSACRSS